MSKSQRQKQKDRTREHIIEVAINQLAKDGLTAARTADIATAAEVSHGTVFAHFPTKEVLLNAVIEEFGIRITHRLHELVDNGGSVREVLNAHLKGLTEFEPFYTRLVLERRMLPESAQHTLVAIQSAVSFHLSEALERESAAGTIRPLPVHLHFNTWIGLIHYYLVNSDLFAPDGSVLARFGQGILEHYLALITK